MTVRRGRYGEQLAAEYLKDAGYEIIANNWRYGRLGEIDLIVTQSRLKTTHESAHYAQRLGESGRKAGELVFVEVKTRRNDHYGSPLEAITPAKVHKLRALARAYYQINPHKNYLVCRFDVIGITFQEDRSLPRISHRIACF